MLVSRYALSSGITDKPGREVNEFFYPTGWAMGLLIGRDAHREMPEAIVAAEALRMKKIASLEKQIKKLQAMKFA